MAGMERYFDHRIADLFSGEETRRRWLMVEFAHLRQVATLPQAQELAQELALVQEHPQTLLLDGVSDGLMNAYEARTGHDIGGFLQLVEDRLASHSLHQMARWLHWGLTSSDLVDTANALAVHQALKILRSEAHLLARALVDLPGEAIAGRTHGQVASPTSVAARFAPILPSLQVKVFEQPGPPVMLSGAVGQYRVFPERLARVAASTMNGHVCESSQVMSPEWFDRQLGQVKQLVWATEKIGLDLRLMAMLGEYRPKSVEVGSSTMPSKVNPYLAERLCGLAKLWRGLYSAWSESRALWLERDLHHSSVDRVTLGPMFAIAGYMVKLADRLIREATWPDQDMSRFEPAIDADLLLGESTARVNLPRTAVYARVREAIREEQSEMGFHASTDGVRARLGWF